MKGTLALWYEPAVGEASAGDAAAGVELELHANLWRDLPSRTNFLDLGLLFGEVDRLSRFYLYVPARLSIDDVTDLSPVLRLGVTANAVFNDVVALGAEGEGSYEIRRGEEVTTIYRIGRDDIELERADDPLIGNGTRIVFKASLCSRMRIGTGKRYLRLRIVFDGDAATTFSSEVVARDRAFASSAGRLELTEFRLNERRSYPAAITERADLGRFRLRTVHYFLIRDIEHQLVVQHAPFEKVRRLETALWSDYVADAYGADTERVADRLVIYHWKVKARDGRDDVGDFIAFASFRTTTTSLTFYAFMIVLLGAAGSVLATLLADLAARLVGPADPKGHLPWSGWPTGSKGQLLGFATLAALIAAIAYWPSLRARASGLVPKRLRSRSSRQVRPDDER